MRKSAHVDTAPEFAVANAASFGAGIRFFRRETGMPQADLAARSRVHQSYLSALEGGKTTQQLDAIVRLLNGLGVDIVLRRRQ